MGFMNLLDIKVEGFWQTFDVSLGWIGDLIRILINWIGIVGIGIIAFSLILKLITLPLDVYQRTSMRKQNIKMKENKEKMEKLQKQYANNKELYNQKVMEMYKESGISIFSSCLPMIVSLVIFIVAINAFNAYSQYANIQNYNTMVNAYNDALRQEYCVDLDTSDSLEIYIETTGEQAGRVKVTDSNNEKPIYYYVASEGFDANADITAKKAFVKEAHKKYNVYYFDEQKIEANETFKTAYEGLIDPAEAQIDAKKAREAAIQEYFKQKAQAAVVTTYEKDVRNATGFLWIKNIWVTDASYQAPIMEYDSFATAAQQESFAVGDLEVEFTELGAYTKNGNGNPYTVDVYTDVTANLSAQKEEANGYYILILLSIGTILLQQFVMMRSQKEQQKYSSVDGQGASQQKMMMIIMTGMFAIFSFMYSSAFSIYLITSNIFSMISTVIINKCVDVREAKKAAAVTEVRQDKRASMRLEAAQKAGKNSARASREKKAAKTEENDSDKKNK